MKFKNINNLFLLATPLIGITTLLTSCNDSNNGLDNTFNNIVVNSDEFIKGVDVSSYTSTLTNFLYENKIQDSSIEDSQTKIIKYNFDELENKKVKGQNDLSLLEYTDKHLYSYIDSDGKRIYDNLFSILNKQAGINSIRLRLWVDPKDENNNYYTSGINSTFESTVFTINQAKKHGISDFQLNLHYSDFWADPARQYAPKSWLSYTTEEMCDELYQYTYNTIIDIYKETQLFPSSVQLGNEITNGFIWNNDNKYQFASGYKNSSVTAKYLESASKALNDVNKYIEQNNIDANKVEGVIHIENPSSKTTINFLNSLLSNQVINQNVGTIGVTYYPFWGEVLDNFFKLLTNTYSKFNKNIIIEEYSSPYKSSESGYIGDLNKKDFTNIPTTTNGQIVLLQSFLTTISKAFPNNKTGFYYWEPGWIKTGYSSWATPEGIKYAVDGSYEKIKGYKDGFNWSSQELFDQNGLLLPTAKVLKNFKRINSYSDVSISLNNQLVLDLVNQVSSWNSFKDSYIVNNSPIYIDINDPIHKTPLKAELFRDFDDIHSDTINLYPNDIKELNTESVINLIKNTYPRIAYHQVKFGELQQVDSLNYYIDIYPVDNSYLYNESTRINICKKEYYSTPTIDLTNQSINISTNDQNWSNNILSLIENDLDNKTNFSTTIWNQLGINGGISKVDSTNQSNQYDIWLYDNQNDFKRYADWVILKTDKLYESSYIDFDDTSKRSVVDYNNLLSNQYTWPKTLNKNVLDENGYLYFGIKKQINDLIWNKDLTYTSSTFQKVGKESWTKIGLVIVKFKINLI